MKQANTTVTEEVESVTVRGANFNGHMKWVNGALQLNLIDFQKKAFYYLEVND